MINNKNRIIEIKKRLQILNPAFIQVIDESDLHIGHAGSKSGKGHFKLIINSPQFKEKTKLKIHQMIYAALGDYMTSDIHALSISNINKI